jgi:hypothetical protein
MAGKGIGCSIVFIVLPLLIAAQKHKSQHAASETIAAKKIDLPKELNVFSDPPDSSTYFVSVCADVPDNKRPEKVVYKGETGHVFLIFQMISPKRDTVSKVFGFYPKSGSLPTVFTRNVKSGIRDNSARVFDVKITNPVTQSQFKTVLLHAITLSKKRYRMNRFNCYDYAVQVFNSVAGSGTIVRQYSKFPFLFGSGGSPCSLFAGLRTLQSSSSFWRDKICFQTVSAPVSTPLSATPSKD